MTQEERPRRKNYVIDTNVLIENPNSVLALRNGNENNSFIPYHVLMELETLKNTPKLRHIVSKVIATLIENRDHITFIRNDGAESPFTNIVDNYILREIESAHDIADPILVTNDRLLQLQASLRNIRSEELRDSKPFESESQRYTGFVEEGEPPAPNSFSWRDGKPVMAAPDGETTIGYTNDFWNLKPRTVNQNLALELIVSEHVDLDSIQS